MMIINKYFTALIFIRSTLVIILTYYALLPHLHKKMEQFTHANIMIFSQNYTTLLNSLYHHYSAS